MNRPASAPVAILILEEDNRMSDKVPRGPQGRRRYAMDYIPDPTLYRAVMFARKMIRDGTPPGVAISRAAGYYKVNVTDVARYTGQTGGTLSHRRRERE